METIILFALFAAFILGYALGRRRERRIRRVLEATIDDLESALGVSVREVRQ
jgi:Flp pilus assembly protein TadB